MEKIKMIDTNADNILEYGVCGYKSIKRAGYPASDRQPSPTLLASARDFAYHQDVVRNGYTKLQVEPIQFH